MNALMARMHGRKAEKHGHLTPPPEGVGPLLQRDYWAVIARCRLTPSEVATLVARHFEAFAPEDLVVFRREDPEHRLLRQGDDLSVHIKGAGHFAVRVVHLDAQSLTLCTMDNHPEAGRITFGAYRNRRGDVVFHIRSLARSNSPFHLMGFVVGGEAMQTNTWTEFVNRVAVTAGEGVIGAIYSETKKLHDEPDDGTAYAPTFRAEGDAT